jgi:hypothetical protein
VNTLENKGNLITRRAFADTNRMATFRQVTNKAWSSAYQMTEEVGEYGSGRPSPLHMLCELIAVSEEADRREGKEFSTALEQAEYPLLFLMQLRGALSIGKDAVGKLNLLNKSVSDAMYILNGRDVAELTPNELKECRGLGLFIDAKLAEASAAFPGAPVQGERSLRRA